jgi:pimeloyl-ACP methyl ester carboxylesterase
VALFDLSATPEAESQGRFATQLAARAPAGAATIVLVDEAAFRQRFGGDSARLAQRRDAWRAFGEALGSLTVCIDLDSPDHAGASRALQLAMRSPVAKAPP